LEGKKVVWRLLLLLLIRREMRGDVGERGRLLLLLLLLVIGRELILIGGKGERRLGRKGRLLAVGLDLGGQAKGRVG
jgi:hypothetical protein